jgi:signal transduction histidine kinase
MESATQIELQHLLLESRAQERQQIARDLHDGPIQEVIGLIFMLQDVLQSLPDNNLRFAVTEIVATAQKLADELRDVCNELRPPALTQFGLSKAIQSHVVDFTRRHPEYRFDLQLDDDQRRLSDNTRLALFRIYQECLNNVIRHAGATQVSVHLKLQPDTVMLDVQDNGSGFDASGEKWVDFARGGHLGLVGMKERAEAAGGQLQVKTAPGAGTCIHVAIPF